MTEAESNARGRALRRHVLASNELVDDTCSRHLRPVEQDAKAGNSPPLDHDVAVLGPLRCSLRLPCVDLTRLRGSTKLRSAEGDPNGFLFARGNDLRVSPPLPAGVEKMAHPTQRAWTISRGVSFSLCPASPPHVLERLLRG